MILTGRSDRAGPLVRLGAPTRDLCSKRLILGLLLRRLLRSGDIPDLPSNQRFLDPEASGTAGYNLSLPVLAARQAADATWQRLSRADRPTGNMSAVREIWGALRGSLPKGYLVEPLYGLSCGDTDSCIGIVEGSSDCVCYKP